MRYPTYFIAVVFICSISGIIISFLNNDLVVEQISNNPGQNNNNNLNKK